MFHVEHGKNISIIICNVSRETLFFSLKLLFKML